MSYRQQQEQQNDLFDALTRISEGNGTAEDAECLNIDPQALQVFYQWSEQNAK